MYYIQYYGTFPKKYTVYAYMYAMESPLHITRYTKYVITNYLCEVLISYSYIRPIIFIVHWEVHTHKIVHALTLNLNNNTHISILQWNVSLKAYTRHV